MRYKVLLLLYYYRYLNNIDLTNLSCINFITYGIRIKANIKLTFNFT